MGTQDQILNNMNSRNVSCQKTLQKTTINVEKRRAGGEEWTHTNKKLIQSGISWISQNDNKLP